MPTGPNGERRPRDMNQRAVMVGRLLVGEIEEEYDDEDEPAASKAPPRSEGRSKPKKDKSE